MRSEKELEQMLEHMKVLNLTEDWEEGFRDALNWVLEKKEDKKDC